MRGITDQDYLKIVSLLESIKELIGKFYDFTCKQTDILKTDDLDLLVKNIDDRQVIIDEIDSLRQSLNILLKPYEHIKLEISSDDPSIKQIASLQEQIKQTLRETRQVSELNDEAAKGKKEKFRSEGKRLSMSHKSIKLYNQDVLMQESVFYDKRK